MVAHLRNCDIYHSTDRISIYNLQFKNLLLTIPMKEIVYYYKEENRTHDQNYRCLQHEKILYVLRKAFLYLACISMPPKIYFKKAEFLFSWNEEKLMNKENWFSFKIKAFFILKLYCYIKRKNQKTFRWVEEKLLNKNGQLPT